MISVVMSVYNGSKYIKEQLESLICQEHLPDEIVIIDDCSKDNTISIINGFIKQNHTLPIAWKLILNEENMGWKKSFYKAILSSNGDIIFLCDQDDVWKKSKIKEMNCIIQNNKEIGLLVCGYEVFYEDLMNGINKHSYNCSSHNTGNVCKAKLNSKFMYVAYPGCTYAFTREFFSSIQKYWNDKFAHDAILWRYSLIKEKAYILDKDLIRWRRHATSSSLIKNVLNTNVNENKRSLLMRIELSDSRIIFLNGMLEMVNNESSYKDKVDLLEKCIDFENKHLNGLKSKSVLKILVLFILKRKYFLSYRTVLGDVVSIFKFKFGRKK